MNKFFFMICLFLFGCQGFNVGTVQSKVDFSVPDIFRGTSALEVNFLDVSSRNILMCSSGNAFISLKNSGAYNVTGKYIFIMDQFLSPTSDISGELVLEGKSRDNPIGGQERISFNFVNRGLPSQLQVYNANVIFQACYEYKTFASAVVCVDPDIENLNPNKPCRSDRVVLSGGQGAPVEVVAVEPSMISSDKDVKPLFKIFVRHSGIGQVIAKSGVGSACSHADKNNNLNFASLVDVIVKFQGKDLKCTPKVLRLEYNQENYITCYSDDKFSSATFSSPLLIQLSYGYVSTAVLPVSINRVKGQTRCD